MNDKDAKNKLKMADIIDELNNIKKYNNELFSNVHGEKLENYLNELDKSIVKAENQAETLYTKYFDQ